MVALAARAIAPAALATPAAARTTATATSTAAARTAAAPARPERPPPLMMMRLAAAVPLRSRCGLRAHRHHGERHGRHRPPVDVGADVRVAHRRPAAVEVAAGGLGLGGRGAV